MSNNSKNNPLGLLAFLALVLEAVCMTIMLVNRFAGLDIPTSILLTIANVFLLIVIFCVAWSYARTLHTCWKILFFVMLILTIAGLVVPLF